jgi:hypothetical protein
MRRRELVGNKTDQTVAAGGDLEDLIVIRETENGSEETKLRFLQQSNDRVPGSDFTNSGYSFLLGSGIEPSNRVSRKTKNDHSQFVHEIEFYVTSRQISTLVAQKHFGLERTKPLIDNSTVDRF